MSKKVITMEVLGKISSLDNLEGPRKLTLPSGQALEFILAVQALQRVSRPIESTAAAMHRSQFRNHCAGGLE